MKLRIRIGFTIAFCFLVLAIGIPKELAPLWPQVGGQKTAIQYRTCGADDLQQQLRPAQSNKFVVVTVGDGVKDATPATTRPYSSNYAQGWDLYKGVAFAATKDPFRQIAKYIDLVYVDDGGDSRCAKLMSDEIGLCLISRDSRRLLGQTDYFLGKLCLHRRRSGNSQRHRSAS